MANKFPESNEQSDTTTAPDDRDGLFFDYCPEQTKSIQYENDVTRYNNDRIYDEAEDAHQSEDETGCMPTSDVDKMVKFSALSTMPHELGIEMQNLNSKKKKKKSSTNEKDHNCGMDENGNPCSPQQLNSAATMSSSMGGSGRSSSFTSVRTSGGAVSMNGDNALSDLTHPAARYMAVQQLAGGSNMSQTAHLLANGKKLYGSTMSSMPRSSSDQTLAFAADSGDVNNTSHQPNGQDNKDSGTVEKRRRTRKQSKKVKENVKEELRAEMVPGHRGNLAIDDLMQYINNTPKSYKKKTHGKDKLSAASPENPQGGDSRKRNKSSRKERNNTPASKNSATATSSSHSSDNESNSAVSGSDVVSGCGADISDQSTTTTTVGDVSNHSEALSTGSCTTSDIVDGVLDSSEISSAKSAAAPPALIDVIKQETDGYMFTDFEHCNIPHEDDFKVVSKKKRKSAAMGSRPQARSQQLLPARSYQPQKRSFTPPPNPGCHEVQDFSPSSFPELTPRHSSGPASVAEPSRRNSSETTETENMIDVVEVMQNTYAKITALGRNHRDSDSASVAGSTSSSVVTASHSTGCGIDVVNDGGSVSDESHQDTSHRLPPVHGEDSSPKNNSVSDSGISESTAGNTTSANSSTTTSSEGSYYLENDFPSIETKSIYVPDETDANNSVKNIQSSKTSTVDGVLSIDSIESNKSVKIANCAKSLQMLSNSVEPCMAKQSRPCPGVLKGVCNGSVQNDIIVSDFKEKSHASDYFVANANQNIDSACSFSARSANIYNGSAMECTSNSIDPLITLIDSDKKSYDCISFESSINATVSVASRNAYSFFPPIPMEYDVTGSPMNVTVPICDVVQSNSRDSQHVISPHKQLEQTSKNSVTRKVVSGNNVKSVVFLDKRFDDRPNAVGYSFGDFDNNIGFGDFNPEEQQSLFKNTIEIGEPAKKNPPAHNISNPTSDCKSDTVITDTTMKPSEICENVTPMSCSKSPKDTGFIADDKSRSHKRLVTIRKVPENEDPNFSYVGNFSLAQAQIFVNRECQRARQDRNFQH